ncbi:MAG: hypothetical protein CSA33_05505 [Desulfobulbus propionicus]|nr:MAG: hypothetical protein CSA33_05505 [Desulfobulbus propionicus]
MKKIMTAGCITLLFACPTVGSAAISYTDFTDITTHSSHYFDVDGDGTSDVGVVWGYDDWADDTTAEASVPLGANAANGFAQANYLASQLSLGDTIDESLDYYNEPVMLSEYWDDWEYSYSRWGEWDNMGADETAYLGFQFIDGGNALHYGWIQARVNPDNLYITLYDMAWETTANTAIEAGNTGSPVPIPGAVWLLGSALLGLVGIRRR